MDDMAEFKDIFLSELEENISLLNTTLIGVEKDPNSAALIQDLVRAVHTVKGMSAQLGYDSLTQLTHELENHLMSLNNVSKDLIQTLFRAADKMREFHDGIRDDKGITGIEVKTIIDSLQSSGGKPAEDIRLGQKYKMIIRFSSSTRLLGARGFQAYRAIAKLAEIVTSDPPIAVLEAGDLLGDIDMEIITYESETTIRTALKNVGDIDEVVLSALLDDAIPSQTTKASVGPASTRAIQSVRVNLDKLDNVVDLLGELVITRGRFQSLVGVISPEMSEQLQLFDNTISTIQDSVMGLRMVNLSRIFDTFPRVIRDIAHSRNMEITLLLQGTHIQIDRSVVDQINEALLHLLRNAAIHGIEDTDARRKSGKSPNGTIRLAAKRERGEVVFEIEDDGGGIDIDSIRAKAIEEGIINTNVPLNRTQIASLIFQSGFSTAKELTDIAGRGVGMGIVRTTIEEISGNIQVRTKKGVGTKFIIRVPQTLAIIDALIVEIGPQLFAIPLLNVEKILSAKDPSVELHDGKQYVKWDDANVRIVDMGLVLNREGVLPSKDSNGNGSARRVRTARKKIILWERAGKRVGLSVSNIVEQREIVTKQLDEVNRANLPGFSGATILGYDEVALILDPDYY